MMISRRLLLAGAGSLAVLAGLRWTQGSDVEAATSFEVEKSDAEWRRLLTSAQYNVLRRQGKAAHIEPGIAEGWQAWRNGARSSRPAKHAGSASSVAPCSPAPG